MIDEPTCCIFIDTPLGKAMAAAEADAIIGFWFVGQKYYPAKTGHWVEQAECPVFASLQTWLEGYFAGKIRAPDFPLAPRGTVFQKSVWDILLQIPYGTLATYGSIARQMTERQNKPHMSAQAVGGAVGRNPISVLIPCHRIIGSGGGLTGYAGGLEKKTALLRLEGAML